MESAVTPGKSKLARSVAKVVELRVGKVQEKRRSSDDRKTLAHSFEEEKAAALEALLAMLFASVSTVKASYAQLQFAQSPYDVDGIRDADQTVVSELKILSGLKQCYVMKQLDRLPENAVALAEVEEQKSLLKTYEIMAKKVEAQTKNKESQIGCLREKLEELKMDNKLIERRVDISGISHKHFNSVVGEAVKSVRRFVRLMIGEMTSADWDIEAAANSIQPGVVYWKPDHVCFAFESFVCNQMFDGSNLSIESRHEVLLERLKSMKPREYLAGNPNSAFGRMCRAKYLTLVHPKMEESFFGNLDQRNLVDAGKFPETSFFYAFSEMAKRVFILHYLAFSIQPEASIYMISRGSRFSEVYMESVADEPFMPRDNSVPEFDPRVAFTVVPGFRIGKIVVQSQVYISHLF